MGEKNHIKQFNSATFFVPVQIHDINFQCNMSWSYLFSII